ncbi:MAG TPA: L,D-transpeptidase family protein [Sphingomicrobium sp.]|nr:L,D-transpeptidase family protein [Sphingomicrobium sp.]
MLSAVAATAASAQPVPPAASTQPVFPTAAVQLASLPTAGAVTAFYNKWSTPMWFHGATANPAVGRLAAILRRAQFDGLASGPQLASQVEAAVARAASGNPADVMAAEQMLSAAWVLYVQTLKRPTSGMIYAYSVLAPQNTRADQILLTAAASPSLEAHLQSVSNVNPTYAQIREAAWLQSQASAAAPDPRLLANLERARVLPPGGRFVVVDSATQRMTMYENGQPVDSMKVIVGMSSMPTPLIASMIHYVTFNPYWNVPHHLVRKTIAPNVLKQGMGYLKSRGYEVMADWSEDSAVLPSDSIDWKAVQAGKQQIRVRQKPGPGNSMGKMKFRFPSGEDIYLHDTPSKNLFAKSQRTLSNGCVRLEDAARLGRWLLGREPVAPSADPEIRVQLAQGVPVYLTYLTAQPSSAGVSYLADVYGWDKPAAQQVASN